MRRATRRRCGRSRWCSSVRRKSRAERVASSRLGRATSVAVRRFSAREADVQRFIEEGVGRNLRDRARSLLASFDRFFAARAFLEVDTPALVPSPGLDLHLDAVDGRRRLPHHVARVPDEAAARRRRAAHLPARARVSARRDRRPAQPRVHDARVVPRFRRRRAT